MIDCYYPNCKKHKSCNLHEPSNTQHQQLLKEIGYWLNQLKESKRRLKEYEKIVKDITTYHKYSIPINVYGHIEYAPKINVFGVFIRRPEHVNYGWNLNKLTKARDDIMDTIRKLRLL